MSREHAYLFTSDRLGFRCWRAGDLDELSNINADPAVMEFFPAVQSVTDTQQFMQRMADQFAQYGYCYYAVDRLDTGKLIGFTGLCKKEFGAAFTPCVDIGWRFATTAWNKGFATEAAKRCLQHGFQTLGLRSIVSMAPVVNVKSIAVMEKAGMHFEQHFDHPQLLHDERLRKCVLYRMDRP